MSYNVKLEVFEGPFDLLYHLIEKNEVDIYDIPIAEITYQYLEYLDGMRYFDIEIASEFLVMAATLLQIKSRMLLPKQEEAEQEEAEDPRRQLVERLIEYRKYKSMTGSLRDREDQYLKRFFREPSPIERYVDYEPVLVDIDIADLCRAFDQAMKKYQDLYNDNTDFIRNINKEKISIADRVRFIRNRLRGGEIFFSSLFDRDSTREGVVITFLAMLELIRLKKVFVEQRYLFDEIIIRERKNEVGDSVWTGKK